MARRVEEMQHDQACARPLKGRDTLHIIPDDKFTRDIVASFERFAPQRNRYIAVSAGPDQLHQSLHETSLERVSRRDAIRIVSSPQWRLVIFHSLPWSAYSVLRAVRPGPIVFWRIWGYEVYGSLLRGDHGFPEGFLEPQTRKLVFDGRKTSIIRHLHSLRRSVKRVLARVMLRRVDIVAPVIPVEGRVLLEKNPWLRPTLTEWEYPAGDDQQVSPREARLPYLLDKGVSFGILGHSGDPRNNHLDAAILLQDSQIWQSVDRVVVPVSYGAGGYIAKLRQQIRQIIPNAVFLGEFISPVVYSALIRNAKFIVHFGLRQIGMGNINIALEAETPIILNPMGIVKRHFGEIGYQAFTAEQLMTLDGDRIAEVLRGNKLKRVAEQKRVSEIMAQFIESL